MLIEVTHDDINHGKRGQCFSCPIARAVSRALDRECFAGPLEGEEGILVWHPYSGSDDDDTHYTGSFLAMLWMFQFDNGDPVKPFSFELEEKHED